MRNADLAADYIRRARARLGALDVLFDAESWPDVVRESQEVVELALKGCLRHFGIEAPRIHDVSDVLLDALERFPPGLQAQAPRLAAISRELRRDRELAFYGAEDLTPSGFYARSYAEQAREGARFVVRVVGEHAG